MTYFEMAYNLGIPIEKVYDMTYEVFLGWLKYFSRRPIGWKEDLRTHKLLQVQGVKEAPEKIFATIKQMVDAERGSPEETNFDVDSFKRSSMFQRMSRAKGGDQIL